MNLDLPTTGDDTPSDAIPADDTPQDAGTQTPPTDEGSDDAAPDEGQAADTDPPAEDEHVEIEREGKKYRIPKALEGELMMRADHTRKTQEVAQQRQALEQERETFRQQAELQRQFSREIGQVQVLNDRIAEFETYDWQAYMAQSPQEAQAAWMEFQQVEKQRDRLVQTVTAKHQAQTLEAQREHAQRLEQGRAELERDIGWTPQLGSELNTFSVETYGFTQEELNTTEPRHVKALHDAMMWRRHQAAEAQKAKVLAQQKTQPAHTSRGQGGRFEVSGDTDDFSAFEKMAASKIQKR